mgnify:CR=1 FL=1
MKEPLLQKLGLLGVVRFLSYTAAVLFAPLAYPGYNWMALWNQPSALYSACEVVCVTVACIGIQGALRTGKLQIYIRSVYTGRPIS